VHASVIVPTVPKVACYPVPRLPGRFVHVGRRIEIERDGDIVVHATPRPGDDADDGLLGLVGGVFRALGEEWLSELTHTRFADHAPAYYASMLWNAYLQSGETRARQSEEP
jgi:hypothetical protein